MRMTPLERLQAAVNLEQYDRPLFADNEWNELLGEMVPHLAHCPRSRPCMPRPAKPEFHRVLKPNPPGTEGAPTAGI
jgi:hypothetical protein